MSQAHATMLTKEKNAIVTPERHDDTSRLVYSRRLDIFQTTSFPNRQLAITPHAKSSRRNLVQITHPYHTGALDPTVRLRRANRVTPGTRIKQAQFPVPAGRRHERPRRIKSETLNHIAMSCQNRPR